MNCLIVILFKVGVKVPVVAQADRVELVHAFFLYNTDLPQRIIYPNILPSYNHFAILVHSRMLIPDPTEIIGMHQGEFLYPHLVSEMKRYRNVNDLLSVIAPIFHRELLCPMIGMRCIEAYDSKIALVENGKLVFVRFSLVDGIPCDDGVYAVTHLSIRFTPVTKALEVTGQQVTEAFEVTGQQVTKALEVTGQQVTEAFEVTGQQVTKALEVTGQQVAEALIVTGQQVTEALIVTGQQVTKALEVTGQQVTEAFEVTCFRLLTYR
jgi:hypothetical protein